MKIPVLREDREDSPYMIDPAHRLSGAIATLNRPKRDNDTDGDWQTVTTDRPVEAPKARAGALFHGAGSSLADISDVLWHQLHQTDDGSAQRIVQHPFADTGTRSLSTRDEKPIDKPAATFKEPNAHPGVFLPNSSRNTPAPQSRAAAAIRLFSNPFRRDSILEAPSPRFIEMDDFGHSYESLSSEQALRDQESGSSPGPATHFRWSRIQNNLSRSVPRTPATVFDQPLYRSDVTEPSHIGNTSHAPHGQFLGEIPHLPFPLISLPEAAMIQHYRRERGEEDHTETAVSFTAKSRSCTVSSIASSQPTWTPMSPDFGRQSGHSAFVPKSPALVHRGSGVHEKRGIRPSKSTLYYVTTTTHLNL